MYGEYLQTVSRNPVQIGEVEGGVTEAMAAPVDVTGAAHSDTAHEERTQLYKNVCEKRRAQVEFLGIATTTAEPRASETTAPSKTCTNRAEPPNS